ncbi:hypothetical protein GE09DRAFT_1220480 [Coniochaeta sp. 2T2.1]|nr:hypothetical protein GE09DRAFT_1220480 [Coniochaeta sp. 2T2.1]
MAGDLSTATPAKHGFKDAGMNAAALNTTTRNSSNADNQFNSNAAHLMSYLTPHKRASAYVEDTDDSDDDYGNGGGGGAKLTPQPRGVKSDKPVRYQDYAPRTEQGGGASLSGAHIQSQGSSLFSPPAPQVKRWGKSVAFAKTVLKDETETETEDGGDSADDGHTSDDEAETVTTTTKTTTTKNTDETTLGSSPNSVTSGAYSATTPKAHGFVGYDESQLTKSVPHHFAPRHEAQGITELPPPSFDLPSTVLNLVDQAAARATQSTPVKSFATGLSPVKVGSQPYIPPHGTMYKPTIGGSPFKGSSALVPRDNGNIDVFRSNNLASPGSVTSSNMQRDSFGSTANVSLGQLQRRCGLLGDTDLQELIHETRMAFEKINLPKLNTQPKTFDMTQAASDTLNFLTNGFSTRPPIDLATSSAHEPFIQSAVMSKGSNCPVVKIDDLPYEAKVSDIIAFVGGNAKILNDADEPVHIMMERITTKTGAAYVEFYEYESAVKVVDKHRLAKAHGKPDALLKDLFPYAREVDWINGQPVFKVAPEVFKGFVTEEELISLVKNVEFPHRVPYTKACPQRSVETLISILKKLPWHMTHYITIRHRHRIYKASVDMIAVLQGAIYNNSDHHHRRGAFGGHGGDMRIAEVLNEKLLKRVVRAAMSCPGFTPLMKDNIAFVSSLDAQQVANYDLPVHANRWRHVYTLMPNPSVPADVIDYYIALIREETTRMVDALPPMLRRQVRAKASDTDPFFGFFWAVAGFPSGDEFDSMSLHKCSALELNAIDTVLGRALPGGGQGMLTQ